MALAKHGTLTGGEGEEEKREFQIISTKINRAGGEVQEKKND